VTGAALNRGHLAARPACPSRRPVGSNGHCAADIVTGGQRQSLCHQWHSANSVHRGHAPTGAAIMMIDWRNRSAVRVPGSARLVGRCPSCVATRWPLVVMERSTGMPCSVHITRNLLCACMLAGWPTLQPRCEPTRAAPSRACGGCCGARCARLLGCAPRASTS